MMALLLVVSLDAIVRQVLFTESTGSLTTLVSILIYLVTILTGLRLLGLKRNKALLNLELSNLGAFYMYAYSLLLLSFAIFIPGSSYVDQICEQPALLCSFKIIALEVLRVRTCKFT